MKISVALPTWNGGKFLLLQLESIQLQTRRPDELIITDDASDDDSMAIAEEFQRKVKFPVRIFSNAERLGCNGNFGRAISMCSGDVVALSDQDDVWRPEHLERLIQPFERDEQVSLTVSNSAFVDENLKAIGGTLWGGFRFGRADAQRLNRGPALRQWVKHHVTSGHASAFRRSLVPVILPFPQVNYDEWLSLVCAACGKVVMIDEILTLHRQHSKQTHAFREVSLAEKFINQSFISQGHFKDQISELRQLILRLENYPDVVRDFSYKEILQEKIDLLRYRQMMREGGRFRRGMMAAGLLIAGKYHRIGRGFLTFGRDVRG